MRFETREPNEGFIDSENFVRILRRGNGNVQMQVTELLDQLAGTVIYSRQHLLEQPYLVRPGDTLSSIARRYGTSVEAIMAANRMFSAEIRIGQQLIIPAH